MTKQLIARIDDDLKILMDAIMAVRGETQQIVLHQACIDYVVKSAETVPNGAELLQSVYSYVIERQKSDIAPLLEKIEKQQSEIAAEEAKQVELMEQYNKVSATEKGKKLLNVLARRLQYDDPRNAILDIFIDDPDVFRDVFELDSTDDENQLITTAMIMARIHTTQV